jgi:predicted TIM-barrel fold metal-dependent hydrolase
MPSIHSGYWDPLFAACNENETVLMMHIGSSSKMPVTSPDAPNSVMAMADWLWSGVLIRYPRLKVGLSECHAGWVPFYLQRADEIWEGHRSWGGTRDILPEPPSTYFPGRIYCSTFGDPVAFRNLELIVDNLMFESDYPHNDTNWPYSLAVAEEATGHLDSVTAEKLVRGNARTLFGLA